MNITFQDYVDFSHDFKSAGASKNSVVKKHSYLKELLKLFILTLYHFSISYFVLEILRFV